MADKLSTHLLEEVIHVISFPIRSNINDGISGLIGSPRLKNIRYFWLLKKKQCALF